MNRIAFKVNSACFCKALNPVVGRGFAWSIGASISLALMSAALSAPGEPPQEGRKLPSFDTFQIIVERNIFDPDRQKEAPSDEPPAPAPPARTDSVTLVGALIQGDRKRAYFKGTVSGFKPAASVGDSFAGLQVKDVQFERVILEEKEIGREWALKMGGSLTRQGDEPWALASRPVAASGTTDIAERALSGEGGKPEEEGEADASSDILQRLMERRRQELNP